MFRDYRAKGVEFYYVYKELAHPEINGIVNPLTIEERQMHIAEAKRRLGTQIPWICDTMDDQMLQTFGPAPNGEYIVDPNGKLIQKRFWSDPTALRKDLAELVGEVTPVTTIDDLDVRFAVETREIASGVVPRLPLPPGLTPLRATPLPDEENPYYAKLRVEATQALAATGKGHLLLSLYPDPLYQVHWNNRAGKVSMTLSLPEGVRTSSTQLEFPDVEADADIDPRQFLVEIALTGNQPRIPNALPVLDPIRVTVHYTVCDDAGTFCLPISQEYDVTFAYSDTLGSRPDIFMAEYFEDLREMDRNGDGNVTRDELPPGKATLYLGHADYDGNGIMEAGEIDRFLKMFNNGRGFDTDSKTAL